MADCVAYHEGRHEYRSYDGIYRKGRIAWREPFHGDHGPPDQICDVEHEEVERIKHKRIDARIDWLYSSCDSGKDTQGDNASVEYSKIAPQAPPIIVLSCMGLSRK